MPIAESTAGAHWRCFLVRLLKRARRPFEIARPARGTRPVPLPFALFLFAAAVLLTSRGHRAVVSAQTGTPGATNRLVPPALQDTGWLKVVGDAQLKAAAELAVFHDFQFTDRVAESGITFRHRIVDDAGKTYKAAHYDHGNGIAIADVDGDGLSDIYFVSQVGGNQLWKNLGGGSFEDITAPAGVGVAGKIGVVGVVRRHRQRRRSRPLRHDRPGRQRPLRERRPRTLP